MTSVEGVQVSPNVVKVTAISTLPAGIQPRAYVYTIYGDGSVEVESSFNAGEGPFPICRVSACR